MAKNSHERLITGWEDLLAGMRAYHAELAQFGPYQVALEETLEEIRVARARQINFKSKHREATQDLNDQIAGGRELVSRTSLLKGHFGPSDERLEAFGIAPARRRTWKPKWEEGKKDGSPGYH